MIPALTSPRPPPCVRRPKPAVSPAVTCYDHTPVLLQEVLQLAQHRPPHCIVDCTLGGAGHAYALLAAQPQAQLLGIDRDPRALQAARARLEPFAARITLVHGQMANVQALAAAYLPGPVDFLLADFGVSSHQLDTADRGFSFRYDAPLDMRMDQTHGLDAAQILTTMDAAALKAALWTLGEERFAGPVARAILAARPRTTFELAACVRAVVPKGAGRIDPATRTFQALRMLTNEELPQIDALLAALPDVLGPGGVAGLISFHSLEDRRVKHALRAHARSCSCPPRLPVCGCSTVAKLRILTSKAVCAQAHEYSRNPRARSARLRGTQRLT